MNKCVMKQSVVGRSRKDLIAFDRCMLDKSTRTLLLQDEEYLYRRQEL